MNLPSLTEIALSRNPFHAYAMICEAMYGRDEAMSPVVREWRVSNFLQHLDKPLELLRRMERFQDQYGRFPFFVPMLFLTKILPDGEPVELGLASMRLVTTAGVNAITDSFQGLFTLSNFKYHGIGTGVGAEATGDTALGTEWAGADYTGGVRATGNQTEGASANIYHTEATNTKASAGSSNVTEHGLFTQAALAGGTLLDRSVFTAVPLAQNEGLLSKYEFTTNAGG